MPYVWRAQDLVEPIAADTIGAIANSALYAVVSGTAATYSAADMQKTIAAGTTLHNGSSVTVAGNAVTLVSDPSNPRWTYTYIDSAGTAAIVSGNPGAAPAVPSLGDNTANSLDLIQANQTIAANITYKLDKRVMTGPLSAWETITTTVLTSAAAAVTFASLSSAYKLFRLTAKVLKTANTTTILTVNNLTTGTYDWNSLINAASADVAAGTGFPIAATASAGGWGLFQCTIGQQLTTDNPVLLSEAAFEVTATQLQGTRIAGSQRNTTVAVTRIDVSDGASTFGIGSRFLLEGNKTT